MMIRLTSRPLRGALVSVSSTDKTQGFTPTSQPDSCGTRRGNGGRERNGSPWIRPSTLSMRQTLALMRYWMVFSMAKKVNQDYLWVLRWRNYFIEVLYSTSAFLWRRRPEILWETGEKVSVGDRTSRTLVTFLRFGMAGVAMTSCAEHLGSGLVAAWLTQPLWPVRTGSGISNWDPSVGAAILLLLSWILSFSNININRSTRVAIYSAVEGKYVVYDSIWQLVASCEQQRACIHPFGGRLCAFPPSKFYFWNDAPSLLRTRTSDYRKAVLWKAAVQ